MAEIIDRVRCACSTNGGIVLVQFESGKKLEAPDCAFEHGPLVPFFEVSHEDELQDFMDDRAIVEKNLIVRTVGERRYYGGYSHHDDGRHRRERLNRRNVRPGQWQPKLAA